MSVPRPEPDPTVRLFHFRWSIPTLAALFALGGQAKFVTLQKKLGASRGSLERTLTALTAAGLVGRNPGYGHPLRPEYLLTAAGRAVAPAAASLVERLERLGILDLALRKWSLPLARALSSRDCRFNRLQTRLGGVTPRALAQALRDLQKAKLVERLLVDEFPPRADYLLTKEGRRVASLTDTLARAA